MSTFTASTTADRRQNMRSRRTESAQGGPDHRRGDQPVPGRFAQPRRRRCGEGLPAHGRADARDRAAARPAPWPAVTIPQRVVTQLASAITNKLIHAPTAGLRQASADGRQDLLAHARKLLGLAAQATGRMPAPGRRDFELPPPDTENPDTLQ